MATSVSASRTALFLDGCSDDGNALRLQLVSASLTSAGAAGTTGIAATPGVRQAVGNPLKCTWTSLLGFSLAAGVCYVQGSTSATAGLYTVTLDTTVTTLACTAADATNPRVDAVAAVVTDNGDGTSTAVFKVIAGIPAPSPVAPALPANSLLLCTIAVPANATALSAGAFTDKRFFTVASGGTLPYPNTAGATIPGPKGSLVYDQATDRVKALDGSGNALQLKAGAFAASTVTTSGAVVAAVGISSTATTILSTTITVDGSTEIEVWGSWIAILPNASVAVNDQVLGRLYLDGSNITASVVAYTAATASTTSQPGGVIRAWATPSAGTHTVLLEMWSLGHASSVSFPVLRVAPSLQQ